ncbi:hypothetical protein BDW42DRAFT_174928 [Aspergillus taichungensis]|uniref:Uncharacterized protein n=1 Tax=Aspergillus taichungensis TaxID=482145 RepID=A0A2J5HMH5_9EURO|nr:hypothetical protein BDW42DRAFT_174928 [Aspergillus taichungensis]
MIRALTLFLYREGGIYVCIMYNVWMHVYLDFRWKEVVTPSSVRCPLFVACAACCFSRLFQSCWARRVKEYYRVVRLGVDVCGQCRSIPESDGMTSTCRYVICRY